MVSMNKLSTAKRSAIVRALCEGCSIRSTVRMTGASKNTVVKLLVELGEACSKFQGETIRGIRSKRVQCDEIWSFVGAKEKNVTVEKKAQGWGDVWTWTALDADSKLIISFCLGDRTLTTASGFMADVASRLANRVQLTTDGHKPLRGQSRILPSVVIPDACPLDRWCAIPNVAVIDASSGKPHALYFGVIHNAALRSSSCLVR